MKIVKLKLEVQVSYIYIFARLCTGSAWDLGLRRNKKKEPERSLMFVTVTVTVTVTSLSRHCQSSAPPTLQPALTQFARMMLSKCDFFLDAIKPSLYAIVTVFVLVK
jgi:hypothetical protein